jgi:hypothetical protein
MSSQPVGKILFLTLIVLSCAATVLGQESQPSPSPQPTPLTAPPPLRTITKAERDQLNASMDPKQKVKTTILLAGVRLTAAEKYTGQGEYESASHEVGSYHALIQNLLAFLASQKRDNNKTRDQYKRLELALRADGPRLTAMRRVTPLEFAVWIKQVEDFAREARTEALNSFYGHTVVRDPETREEKPTEKPKQTPTPDNQLP